MTTLPLHSQSPLSTWDGTYTYAYTRVNNWLEAAPGLLSDARVDSCRTTRWRASGGQTRFPSTPAAVFCTYIYTHLFLLHTNNHITLSSRVKQPWPHPSGTAPSLCVVGPALTTLFPPELHRHDDANGPCSGNNTSQGQQSAGLFGSSTNASQPQSTGGLFGSTSQSQTGGLFGGATSQPPQSASLFGGQPSTSQPQSAGLFGSLNKPAATAGTGSGLFGSSTAQSQPQQSGSLFGGALGGNTQTQTSQPGGLFGGLGQSQQKPSLL